MEMYFNNNSTVHLPIDRNLDIWNWSSKVRTRIEWSLPSGPHIFSAESIWVGFYTKFKYRYGVTDIFYP